MVSEIPEGEIVSRSKYEVDHDGITVFVNDLVEFEIITAFTKNLGSAELSQTPIPVKGLTEPVYYFNRIKVRPEREGTGEGKALMIEVCKIADEHRITIYNELNPYGKRDMKSLKSFFKASGFEPFVNEHNDQNVMVRKPKGV